MQRVAIARALVNDPDILIADEPTGALDTETSIQVMNLLKEVAKDRLVVMVTHNPELAEEYATRIVKLSDGKIIDDSNPYEVDTTKLQELKHENMGKASMSLLTSLSLSFNNLRTKKGRTVLTAFAGSIGIIGIALILSFSNGVNTYISDIQKDTMISYPISIEEQSIDMSTVMSNVDNHLKEDINHDLNAVYSNGKRMEMMSKMTTSISENNLTSFKKYLDNKDSEINKYIGENGIVYSYNTKFDLYTYDSDGTLINADGGTLTDSNNNEESTMNMGMRKMMPNYSENLEELMPGDDGELISKVVINNYNVLYGDWPNKFNEVVLILDENNEIPTNVLYELGILPSIEYKEIMDKINSGEEVNIETKSWTYEDICNQSFYLIPACDYYIKNKNGTFDYIANDDAELENLINNETEIKISAVIKPKDDKKSKLIYAPIGYTKALTNYLIDYTNNSEVVKAQEANKNVNVLNGVSFEASDDTTKIADAKTYLSNLGISDKAKLCKSILKSVYSYSPFMVSQMMAMSESELAVTLDDYLENPDDNILLNIYNSYISSGSYNDNMTAFGVVSLDASASISIYTDSFEDKEAISKCINDYNNTVEEKDRIAYIDYVALLMSSVTTIINVISYVLIAFVSVSLIVSSIMIGIITYISVLERTKEIGILRAIGASKNNISQVFNAETFIIGIFSGVIGIIISLLLLIPANKIIHSLVGIDTINASLPPVSAVALVILSMILTFIGGLIPARKASKKDPVTALRTE
ncbi:FtsX-like permease family protein [Clostridium sp. D53t1_180928_C8]|uniref:FtsX-like permease family protein n=1 Tax=Clostridium sp. D53t1_180928_C8 TaxID=2787101 RepID=UPI00325FBC18